MKIFSILILTLFLSGCGSDSGDSKPTISEITSFTVTNSGATDYIFNGVNDPNFTFKRGTTYTFNLNASGHPFYIKTIQGSGTGNAFNDGVTGNGLDVGTVTFTVPLTAPNTLFYNCSLHSTMTGVITIIN